jgi:lipopolysaccharide export system permease protein
MHRIRIPFLLYSYLATELLAPFFASFLILYGVFFLVRLIPLLEVVLNLGINFPDFIRLFSYIFPHMLLYVIPMAGMAGVIMGFTRLTNDREILALKACGISLRQMLPPVIMVTAVIALLTGYFSIRLIPAGEIAMQQLMFQLAKEKIDRGIKEKKFTEALGDLVVYVDKIDEKQLWHGVYVSDMRNRLQPLITMAKGGQMKADVQRMAVTIVLTDGTLHNAEGKDNQVIRFSRYQLQIPLKPPTRIDGEDVTQLSKGAMSQQQLLERADTFGRTTKKGVKYLTEYHHRLVLPVGCFILSIIGLPLGLQAGPGRKAAGIPLGLGIFILYYISFTLCRSLVETMTLPLVPGMWLPDILFAVLAVYILWRADQEKPLVSEKITDIVAEFKDRYITPLFRRCTVPLKRMINRRKTARAAYNGTTKQQPLPIHANSKSKNFHVPGCEHYNCTDCTIEFNSVRVAREAGFIPCPFCKKLIDKKDR